MSVAYISYAATTGSVEARWLGDALGVGVTVVAGGATLNLESHTALPERALLEPVLVAARRHPWVVAEGVGGFLWAALLRARGFDGGITILPYLNPRSWYDVSLLAVYRRFADARDRIFLGSGPSAALYRAFGIDARVAEPFGIDDSVFFPRPDATDVLRRLGIGGTGPIALFAGRFEQDKDLHRLLAVALKARLLIPDLRVILAAHVVDDAYAAMVQRLLAPEAGVYLVVHPSRHDLARLYSTAQVFVTASTSHFETFGRAPAEALACGTPAVAPRYDGFAEVLAQPGGRLVDVRVDGETPAVDETLLLRAVYETLGGSAPPEEVSGMARSRWSRSRTIHSLDYLRGPPANASSESKCPGPSMATIGAPVVPKSWQEAVGRIEITSPEAGLEFLWDPSHHVGLRRWDPAFQTGVRVALSNPDIATVDRKAVPACP